MALEKITKITGKGVYVSGADIDTDRIIPARYMKVVTFDGLGEFMFRDVKYDEKGHKTDHVLNDPNYQLASILIVDSNFGCGSSREHAPQAIRRAGFNAIIGESFAEIFYGNSLTLGMPCLEASKEQISEITQMIQANPQADLAIDLVSETLSLAGKTYDLSLQASAKDALISGMWDPITELVGNSAAIEKTAKQLFYI